MLRFEDCYLDKEKQSILDMRLLKIAIQDNRLDIDTFN